MIFHINNWSLLLQRAMLLGERKNRKYKIVIARRNNIQFRSAQFDCIDSGVFNDSIFMGMFKINTFEIKQRNYLFSIVLENLLI